MIQFLIETFLIAFLAGIAGAVWYKELRTEMPQKVQKFFLDHSNAWWYKPTWGCVKCISGNMGLRWFLWLELLPGLFLTPTGDYFYPALCYIQNPLAFIVGPVMASCVAIFVGLGATRFLSYLESTTHKYQ